MSFTFPATYFALWAVVIFQGLIMLNLLRQVSTLRQFAASDSFAKKTPLPIGSEAPPFAMPDRRIGEQIALQELKPQGGVILFLTSTCPMCRELAEKIPAKGMVGISRVLAFCQGDEHGCRELMAALGLSIRAVFDAYGETAARYGVSGFPTAVVIDGELMIRGYGHPNGPEDLARLLRTSLSASPPEVGDQGAGLRAAVSDSG